MAFTEIFYKRLIQSFFTFSAKYYAHLIYLKKNNSHINDTSLVYIVVDLTRENGENSIKNSEGAISENLNATFAKKCTKPKEV